MQLAGWDFEKSHLVISALNNKCVSLAAHNVDLRDEEAVDVPVGEEYNRCEVFFKSKHLDAFLQFCFHVC